MRSPNVHCVEMTAAVYRDLDLGQRVDGGLLFGKKRGLEVTRRIRRFLPTLRGRQVNLFS